MYKSLPDEKLTLNRSSNNQVVDPNKRIQNETLLLLSTEISRIRDEKDMRQFIGLLNKFIHFDDFCIFLYDKQQKSAIPFIRQYNESLWVDSDLNNYLEEICKIGEDTINDRNYPIEVSINSKKAEVRKKVLITKLVERVNLVGWLVLLSEKENTFLPEELELLEKLSFQIAIATANSISYNEIELRQQEKEMLLLLSNEIAAVKNRKELFGLATTRIKGLFSVDEFALTQIDEGGQTYSAFLLDLGRLQTSHPDFEDLRNMHYSVTDPFFTAVISSDEPVVFRIDDIVEKPGMPPYVAYWKSIGVYELLFISLRAGGRLVGTAGFHIDGNQVIYEKFPLLKAVCAQLGVAMSNILFHEQIREREEEKSRLLEFSNAIASGLLSFSEPSSSARAQEEISKILRHQLRILFNIEDYIIHELDNSKTKFRPLLYDSASPFADHPDFLKTLKSFTRISDAGFDNILMADEPFEFSLNDPKNKSVYENVNNDFGLRSAVGMPIYLGNEVIAILIFTPIKDSSFSNNKQPFRSICSQLAVAVSNILAYRNIQKRDEEKTFLLSLSMEIAALKTREDLFSVVNNRIKAMLSVEEFGIAQVDEGGETYSAFVLDFSEKTRETPGFQYATSNKFSTNDPIFIKLKASFEPVLFDVGEVVKQPGMPHYVHFWKEAGHKYYLSVPLRVGGTMIGFLPIHFDNKEAAMEKNTLLEGICAQLAVGVSNILANEKVIQRDHEKNILLSLSNEIAKVQSREDLLNVVNGKIKQLFAIKQFGFSKIDEGGNTFSVFIVDVDEALLSHPQFSEMIHAKYDTHDELFVEVMNSPDPILYQVSELINRPERPAYIDFLAAAGIERLVHAPLRAGGIAIGTAQLILENGMDFDVKSTLLKGVCSQLAVAISNILAAEKIRESDNEKSKLLEFSNAIASIHDKLSFLQLLNTRLKKLMSFSHAKIACINDDKETCITYVLDPQGGDSENWDYSKIRITNIPLHNILFDLVKDGFVIVDLDDLKLKGQVPEFIERNHTNGCVEVLIAPLKDNGIIIGFFMLFTRVRNSFYPNQLRILGGITHQLSIAAANIVANEKINKQLEEINRYKQRLEEENLYLQQEIEMSNNHSDIVGTSAAIKNVFRLVSQVAPSDSTVLLLGETGTGKELIARAIHNSSPRKKELMIKINCAALPSSLIESELFGHERGSFTGAVDKRIGKFELANKSTIFLDEIGEMPLELQVKLLRVIQEKEVERIGGKVTIKTDVRIIAATNRDLERLVEEGKFRSDLYYRLNIFPIKMPPLRDRKEDIPLLTAHFINRFSKKSGKVIKTLNSKAYQELLDYSWPGNIRELEHVIERSVLLTNGDTIKDFHLPAKNQKVNNKLQDEFHIQTIHDMEKEYILKVLKQVKGRISGSGGAAELLGIPPSTLSSKMKKLGIRREHQG